MSSTRRRGKQKTAKPSRRQVLCLSGTGVGLLLGGRLSAYGQSPGNERTKPLKRGDKIALNGKPEQIIQRAYELGHQYEAKYHNCARCTVAALMDALPIIGEDDNLYRAATCLDGGATGTGIQSCGGFTGAAMVIGYLYGTSREESFADKSEFGHQLVHEVYRQFAREYGTVLCQDVRDKAHGDCPKVVGLAARWAAEVLLSEFSDYTPVQKAG